MSDFPSITEAAQQIRARTLTPVGLLDRCLENIRNYEDRIHAWVRVDEAGARRTADERTREAAKGEFHGPLHGIPVGIKDIIDVEGWPTEAGSPIRAGHVAAADAPLVAALRRAGAVILGKTVTVEFACFDPSPTRNPWNLAHTPGGSSSGSAAALATNMCLGALGTQTGGSLVRPSTYCGVATCKPTYGTLAMEGIVPVSYHLDHPGPMARTVADLAILLHCLTGREEFRSVPLSPPPRLGFLQAVMHDASEGVRQVTDAALARLRAGGAQIDVVAVPEEFGRVLAIHRRIMSVEAAAYHREQFAAPRDQYGPMITALLDEGLEVLGVDYAAALAWQREFRKLAASLVRDFDALVMPSTDTTAPATLTTTGTPKFQAAWSVSGLPVVSIPCGVAGDGMPSAVQLIGGPNSEAWLLRVALWCEQQIGFPRGSTPQRTRTSNR
jgi:aspartyl-tRNA(Asn)/glutamyl-tRNA(Gln) amidotransferase subunit A